MRKPTEQQTMFFDENMIKLTNYPFLNYVNELLESNKPYSEYDLNDNTEDSFDIPGRIEIKVDNHTAFIDMTSDVLVALYKIVYIRTMQLTNKFEEGLEYVDLQTYES